MRSHWGAIWLVALTLIPAAAGQGASGPEIVDPRDDARMHRPRSFASPASSPVPGEVGVPAPMLDILAVAFRDTPSHVVVELTLASWEEGTFRNANRTQADFVVCWAEDHNECVALFAYPADVPSAVAYFVKRGDDGLPCTAWYVCMFAADVELVHGSPATVRWTVPRVAMPRGEAGDALTTPAAFTSYRTAVVGGPSTVGGVYAAGAGYSYVPAEESDRTALGRNYVIRTPRGASAADVGPIVRPDLVGEHPGEELGAWDAVAVELIETPTHFTFAAQVRELREGSNSGAEVHFALHSGRICTLAAGRTRGWPAGECTVGFDQDERVRIPFESEVTLGAPGWWNFTIARADLEPTWAGTRLRALQFWTWGEEAGAGDVSVNAVRDAIIGAPVAPLRFTSVGNVTLPAIPPRIPPAAVAGAPAAAALAWVPVAAVTGAVAAGGAAVAAARTRRRHAVAALGGDDATRILLPLSVGPYRVLSLLGEGSHGRTYLAERRRSRERVVIKVLRRTVPGLAGAREESVLRALAHPRVVALLGVERIGGRHALVLEHVEGGSLRERLATGPLPEAEWRTVALDVLAALEAVHAARIVHRDVKPSNVLLTADGRAKLADFGVARAPEEDATIGGALPVGTLRYMSPEQAKGHRVTPATDVYAAALVLHEARTGAPYFEADPRESAAELQMRVATAGTFDRATDAPPALWAWFARALDPSPIERFADGAAAREALERALAAPGP